MGSRSSLGQAWWFASVVVGAMVLLVARSAHALAPLGSAGESSGLGLGDAAVGLAVLALVALVSALAGGRVLAGRRPPPALDDAARAADAEEIAALRRQVTELQRRGDESEARFTVTFEQAAVGIAQVGLDGRWIQVNHKLCAIVGYTEEELLPRSFQDITHPEDLDADLEQVRRVLAGEIATYAMEKRYLRKDGSTIWVNLTVSLARGPDGSPDYFISVIEDIQARKDAETRLELWTQAFTSAGFGLIITDVDKGVITAVNPAFAERRGFLPEELVGQPIASIFPADRWAEHQPRLAKIDAQGHGIYESEHVCRDGTRFPVLVDLTSLRDAQGRTTRRVAYVTDISELRQAERALRVSEERLRLFIEHAPVALAMFDRDLRYLAVSRRWQHDFGRGERELVGRLHEEIYPDLPESWKQVYRRSLAGEVIGAEEERFVRRDGAVQWLHWDVRPWYDATGAVGGVLNFSEDISARKLAEQARTTSDERFRDVVEASADWVWELDAENRFVYASESVKALLGYEPHEVLGKTPFDLMTPEEAVRIGAAFAGIAAGHTPFRDLHNVLLHRDGTPRHVMATGLPILDREGALIGYRGVDHDVTDQKLAEKALRDGKATLDAALGAMTDAVFISDVEGRFLHVNEAFATFHRFANKEECRTTHLDYPALLEVRTPDGKLVPPAQWAVPRALRGEVEADAEYLLRRKDTGESWVGSFCFAPIRDPGGAIVGSVITGRDITARKRADESLRQLSLAVEQSTAMVIITDLRGRIGYVNDAFVQQTGYSRDEALGRTPSLLHSSETPPAVYASLLAAMREGQEWRGDFIDRRKDGSTFTSRARISVLRSADGAPSHFVSVQEDVTETCRLQAELDQHRQNLEGLVEKRTAQLAELQAELALRADAAESANRAKSAFLANMSHEIRSPMNAILGFAHVLRGSGLGAEQREQLDKLGAAGEHLLAIINDVLDLSKIEAGKLVLEEVAFSLQSILDGVVSFLGEQARAKGLTMRCDLDAAPLWLRGDPTRLRQAVLNYAGNAIKFTERGGIVLAALPMREEAGRILVRFEVRDTGIGIPADKLPVLFQAFEQADTSTTRRFGGTGLGLTITRQLASLMGGESGVSSQVGVGSVFWFTAWLERAEASVAATTATPIDAKAELKERHAGTRILLAEDDDINQEVALAMLAGTGLRVDIAANGREAVTRAAHPYALILMDMQMPVMDGLTATRAIRALPIHAETPIVAMTANAFADDRRQCFAAGMNDFVPKPVDPALLLRTLLTWLDRRAAGA